MAGNRWPVAAMVVTIGLMLGQAAPARPADPSRSVAPPEAIELVRAIAGRSQCATRQWTARGRAPPTYVQGMALVYAKALCHPDQAHVVAASAAVAPGTMNSDGLAHYDAEFARLGMRNDIAGVDVLRHSFALLIGLGMMESSGKPCEGRDVSQCFTTADDAEAGLFQTSYGARRRSQAMQDMIAAYSADQSGCMQDAFQGAITCKIRRSHNPACPNATSDIAGAGPGADWQRLTKACPAFATEYALVLLRKHGGARGEFGPMRRKQVEAPAQCDSMLREVQTFVAANPGICQAL